MAAPTISRTQEHILDMLYDGYPHTKQEIHAFLPDELSQLTAIGPHLTRIRKYLRPKGMDILCEFRERKTFYRLVRLVGKAAE